MAIKGAIGRTQLVVDVYIQLKYLASIHQITLILNIQNKITRITVISKRDLKQLDVCLVRNLRSVKSSFGQYLLDGIPSDLFIDEIKIIKKRRSHTFDAWMNDSLSHDAHGRFRK